MTNEVYTEMSENKIIKNEVEIIKNEVNRVMKENWAVQTDEG